MLRVAVGGDALLGVPRRTIVGAVTHDDVGAVRHLVADLVLPHHPYVGAGGGDRGEARRSVIVGQHTFGSAERATVWREALVHDGGATVRVGLGRHMRGRRW